MPGHWVIGALVSNQWSISGDDSRPSVNTRLVQPLIKYNFPRGWCATMSPIITVNWNAADGQQWIVPVAAASVAYSDRGVANRCASSGILQRGRPRTFVTLPEAAKTVTDAAVATMQNYHTPYISDFQGELVAKGWTKE